MHYHTVVNKKADIQKLGLPYICILISLVAVLLHFCKACNSRMCQPLRPLWTVHADAIICSSCVTQNRSCVNWFTLRTFKQTTRAPSVTVNTRALKLLDLARMHPVHRLHLNWVSLDSKTRNQLYLHNLNFALAYL